MGQKDRYSEEIYKKISESKYKYRRDNYISKSIRVRKDKKEQYDKAVEMTGDTLNHWINEACRKFTGLSDKEDDI